MQLSLEKLNDFQRNYEIGTEHMKETMTGTKEDAKKNIELRSFALKEGLSVREKLFKHPNRKISNKIINYET